MTEFRPLHLNKLHFRTLCSALALTAGLATSGCTTVLRDETANRLAHPAHLYEHQAPDGNFTVTTYERAYQPGGTADVYIEGDGKAWLSRSEPSLDPTPQNPVALHLATRDNAPNVIYLARPCQYSGLSNGHACPAYYWTTRRYAPEIVAAENAALDELKSRYHFSGYNLVGYSGGAGMAVLLAAQRADVLSIRTVAGDLDPALFSQIHQVTPPAPGSANPITVAAQTAHIPQHHFIGAWDETVPSSIYDSYRRAVGPSSCIRSGIIKEADHDSGWVDKWPDLLKAPLDCNAPE